MQKVINIIVRVIDNLGDVGFACELIAAWERRYPGVYEWDIWTDTGRALEDFFEKNNEALPRYRIMPLSLFSERRGDITLLLFHHELHESGRIQCRKELYLRIDYLSFDPDWVRYSGTEHILSTPEKKIIEIIPSPLREGGGLLPPDRAESITREYLARCYGLDPEKKWVSLFVYSDTFSRLDLDLDEGYEILIFGGATLESRETAHRMPFLPMREFSACIRESSWAIIRGEVSFVSTLQLGTPFLWDMYHEIGGHYEDQARAFLEWYHAESDYSELFMKLSGPHSAPLTLSEIARCLEGVEPRKIPQVKSLVEEIEKYIDSFYKSL